MSELYEEMNESFKNDTEVFFSEESVKKRKQLQFYESMIDRLNYQLFVCNKKYRECMRDYRISIGLPVKEEKDG